MSLLKLLGVLAVIVLIDLGIWSYQHRFLNERGKKILKVSLWLGSIIIVAYYLLS